MIAAHLSVVAFPAEGTSVGKWVRLALETLDRRGVRYELHAMGTELECETLAELFDLVRAVDDALVAAGAQRVTIQLKIDDRRDVRRTLADKVRSVRMPAAGKRSTTRSQTT